MAALRAKAKDNPFFANQKSGSANTREKLASSPLCPEEHLRYELNETPDKRLARQDLSRPAHLKEKSWTTTNTKSAPRLNHTPFVPFLETQPVEADTIAMLLNELHKPNNFDQLMNYTGATDKANFYLYLYC